MSDERSEVKVTRDDFEKLLGLAGDSIYVAYTEYSAKPTQEERELMERMHALIDKPMEDGLYKVLYEWSKE